MGLARHAHYQTFPLIPGVDVKGSLLTLKELTDRDSVVVGIGLPLFGFG
ncbi:MAG: hypothetical protein GQ546_03870 [Gammaproteobacteria bacterium]|nr:hypothetical protein [Gammaproteobacteria bacterium]